MRIQREVFFRPDPVTRQRITVPADLYNRCRLLLGRSETDCAFVPVRSMQYLAVISRSEIIFVDSLGYAVRDGEGGRIILIAWQTAETTARDSLNAPVLLDVVHYREGLKDIQRRLQGEFFKAACQLLDRQRGTQVDEQTMKIVPLAKPARQE